MPRTNIAAQGFAGAYPVIPYSAGGANVAWTGTTDPTDRYTALVEGKTVVRVYNSDTVAQTITIGSVADAQNRTGDITNYSVAAKASAKFGPFKAAGWANAGNLNIDVSDSKLQIAIETLPA